MATKRTRSITSDRSTNSNKRRCSSRSSLVQVSNKSRKNAGKEISPGTADNNRGGYKNTKDNGPRGPPMPPLPSPEYQDHTKVSNRLTLT